jgi:hypothetical protein
VLDCPNGVRTVNFEDRTYECAPEWESRVTSLESRASNLESYNSNSNQVCPAGQFIAGFNSNGSPNCMNLPAGGGRYQTYLCTQANTSGVKPGDPYNGGCRIPNPKTGGCSCPPGFSPAHVNDFDQPAPGNVNGCPQTVYENRGMVMYECN